MFDLDREGGEVVGLEDAKPVADIVGSEKEIAAKVTSLNFSNPT